MPDQCGEHVVENSGDQKSAPYPPDESRFAGLPPLVSWGILLGLIGIIGYGLVRGPDPLPDEVPRNDAGHGDVNLWRAEVQRVHQGESYYTAAGDELRRRGYATRPFFNWRPPFLAWFLAAWPGPALGRWFLIGLAVAAWLLWIRLFFQEGGHWRTLWCALLLYGWIPTVYQESAAYFHEHWAGMLIALSLALHGRNRWVLSALAGTIALFVRELALAFVIVMLVCALWERNWREACLWMLGSTAFLLFLAVHAHIVSTLVTETDSAKTWMRGGGWPFVLSTAMWNSWLILLPKSVTAAMLPLALLGLGGWRGRLGLRVSLSVAAYVCAFMMAGRSNNTYWGLLYAPLLPLGWIFAPRALHDLGKAIRTPRAALKSP